MIPDGKLSTVPVAAEFLTPLRRSSHTDYEWGGVALRDTSQGLQKYMWVSEYRNGVLYLSNGVDAPVPVVTSSGITHHSFAFDQNMNPCVVYNKGSQTWFYWYNSLIGEQETMLLDEYMEYPQVSLDDHRPQQTGNSDIILAYTREDNLYYRLQRERYLQEHFLETSPRMRLTQIGMTKNLRFRWRYIRKSKGE